MKVYKFVLFKNISKDLKSLQNCENLESAFNSEKCFQFFEFLTMRSIEVINIMLFIVENLISPS